MEYRGSKSNNHARIGVKYCTAGSRNLFAGEFQPPPSAMRESGDRNVNTIERLAGGEGGIRTHGTILAYTRFPGAHLRPLGHLSLGPDFTRLSGSPRERTYRVRGRITRSVRIWRCPP